MNARNTKSHRGESVKADQKNGADTSCEQTEDGKHNERKTPAKGKTQTRKCRSETRKGISLEADKPPKEKVFAILREQSDCGGGVKVKSAGEKNLFGILGRGILGGGVVQPHGTWPKNSYDKNPDGAEKTFVGKTADHKGKWFNLSTIPEGTKNKMKQTDTDAFKRGTDAKKDVLERGKERGGEKNNRKTPSKNDSSFH